jgi:hypothetical protein
MILHNKLLESERESEEVTNMTRHRSSTEYEQINQLTASRHVMFY